MESAKTWNQISAETAGSMYSRAKSTIVHNDRTKPLFVLFLLFLLLFPAVCTAASAEVTFGSLSFPKDAESIDLGGTIVKDWDAFEAFLDEFSGLKQVLMWSTQMDREHCDRLAGRYPAVQWGWTMVIRGRDHTHVIRTDDTSFSTLHSKYSAMHGSESFRILKYCWNLMALDIGHNKVDSLDFLYDLPNLRILIAACNQITDITPVGSLMKLEYAELFRNSISDLSPLRNLTHLMDLNLSFNRIETWEVLESMPWLKRLWIYSGRAVNKKPPADVVQRLKAALPDTEIDYTHYPTAGGWRTQAGNVPHPHYAVILQTFGENHQVPRHQYVPFEDSFPDED